jgi:glutaconate CoA-transferase subunit A
MRPRWGRRDERDRGGLDNGARARDGSDVVTAAGDAKTIDIDAAAALVPDGARIALGGGGALMRRPMAFARALARRRARDLHVFHMLAGVETDLLIAARAVASTNCAYVGLLEHGQAPAFQRAARAGEIEVNEYSEFMYIAGLRAADLGIPFIPWRTPWGSETVERLGIATVEDPYSDAVLLAVPATELDVAVIHVERADADGYVELPDQPDLIWDYDYLIARVAKTTIVCAEKVEPLRDPARVAVVGREVAHVVEAPGGAWPTGLHPRYEPDADHLTDVYLPAAAAGGEAFGEYASRYVRRGRDGRDG